MTDLIWVISSSVLILAVIAIRAIFGKRMSAGFRYALWALVLLRLLIPGTVFSSPVSVESAVSTAPVVGDMERVKGVSSVSMSDGVVTGKVSYPRPAAQTKPASPAATFAPISETAATPVKPEEASQQVVIAENATREQYESIKRTVEARTVLNIVWLSGMGLMSAWFVFTNTRMYLTLRKRRVRLGVEAPCPVYFAEGISSSCLFINSVYVSKETAEDGAELKNVLAHELAHRRHGDGLTVFLRGIALILHWYNPFVWIAALLSRRDGEVFADAGAIKTLGEEEREKYGLTLIGLSSKLKKRVGLCTAATTMTGGKRELKERITHMAKHTKTKLIIAAAVTALALAAVMFCFLGCKSSEPPANDDPDAAKTTEAPTPEPTEALTPEPTEEPTDGWISDYTEESEYYAYMQAAADLLANGSLTPVYTCDAYFRLDDDALRAYAKRTELYRIRDDGQYEYSFEYSEPIAEYPREVGEKALNRLYTEIPWLDYVGPFTGAEGFVGDDWFVLKTVDDTMQDIQFSVIFRREGNEWYEFGDNNSQQDRPLFGACIVDENVGFFSYFTKFYDEPDGSYRKIWLYRTDDGGKTWVDMGLEIPEEYGYCYPGYACSPVFDGAHGVMQVLAYHGDGSGNWGLWYETRDGGLTWTLHGDLAAEPTPAPTAIPDPEALRLSLLPDWPTNNIENEWVSYSGVNAAMLESYVDSRIADGFTPLVDNRYNSNLLIRGGTWIAINNNTGVDSSCEVKVTFDSPTEGVDRSRIREAIRNAEDSWQTGHSVQEGELYALIEITPPGFYEATGLAIFNAVFDNSSAPAGWVKYPTKTFLACENGAFGVFYRDIAAADIDGDGIGEAILLEPGPTSGLFSLVYEAYGIKNGQLTRIGVSAYVLDNYGLSSLSAHDGKVYYVWEEQIITPGDPYNATYGEPKEFELTLEDGTLVLNDPEGLLGAGPIVAFDN